MRKVRDGFYVVLAAIFFGLMPVLVKDTYSAGGNGVNIAFYMALICLPVYMLLIWKTGESLRLRRKELALCILAGVTDALTFVLLFLSYSFIPAGIATMLNFVYPVTVAAAMHLFFGERLRPAQVAGLGIYVVGIVMLYGGDYQMNIAGFLLALLSGLAYTAHAIILDKGGLAEKNIYVVGFYKTCTVVVLTGIMGLLLKMPFTITGVRAWGTIAFVALVCRLAAHALIMIGIRGLGALLPAVLSTFEPIVALAADRLVFQSTVSSMQMIGVCCILTAVITVVVCGRKRNQSPSG